MERDFYELFKIIGLVLYIFLITSKRTCDKKKKKKKKNCPFILFEDFFSAVLE